MADLRLAIAPTLCTLFAIAAPLNAAPPETPAAERPADPVAAAGQVNPVPRLLENLASDDVRAATSAARSLGVVFAPGGKGSDDPAHLGQATERLIAELASRRGASLRRESAVALGRMRSRKALDPLQSAIDDQDVDVAVAAADAVAAILPVDEARAYLTQRSEGASQIVQAAVYHALAPIARPEDAPFLVAGLTTDNWRAQAGAVRGLERAVRGGARIEPATYDQVAGVLGNETAPAADAAVHFFTHVRNPESLRAVTAAADARGDGGNDDVGQGDVTWRQRTYALRALRHIGWPTNREALPVVMRNLGDRTRNVSGEARAILAHLRKERFVSQQTLFPILLGELEEADSWRTQAGIMAEMGGGVPHEFASRVAKSADRVLAEAAADPTAWPARARAIALLGSAGHTGSLDSIAVAVGENVPDVRRAAGRALEQLAPLCTPEQKSRVAAHLQPHLARPLDWRKTAIAARAAGDYPAPDAVEPLVKLLAHSVLNVRQAASHALVKIVEADDSPWRAQVERPLAGQLSGQPAAWEHGAPVLGALGNPAAVPQLVEMLARGDWRTQASAARAVARIAARRPIDNAALSETLVRVSQSEVEQVQQAADQALRALARAEAP